MKKIFSEPELEINLFLLEDIMSASSDGELEMPNV